MNRIDPSPISRSSPGPNRWLRRLLPCAMTLAATLIASPGHAITIPNLPLQTGTAYPPANVMFILDDSGSMVFEEMPDDGDFPLSDSVTDRSYVNNTIYYDPSETYLPWMTASGTRLTGGTTYTSAYADLSVTGNSINLGSTSSCKTVDRNGSNKSICGGVQTFYVPKTGVTDYTNKSNFYRYQIPLGGSDVQRSEYGTVTNDSTIPSGFPKTGLSASTGGMAAAYSFSLPSGVTELIVTLSGGSEHGNGADLYVKQGSAPATNSYDCRSQGNKNSETCDGGDSDLSNPASGTWYVALYRSSSSDYSGVTLSVSYKTTNRCGTGSGSSDWINCTSATPTGRSVADELTNYATWFSYHRTRIKVAKSAASEAFGQLGSSIRVGFDSIWNRNSNTSNYYTGSVSTSATPAYKIPVGSDEGLFRGTNRSDWFSQLQGAHGYNGTPLQGALQRSGRYFEDTSGTGPWGPDTGSDQLSCRQNFSILTTDGFWNSTAGYTSIGDSDATDGAVIVSEDEKTSIQYKAVSPYKDNFLSVDWHGNKTYSSGSNTLADVANYYWKRDLVSTLANDVPTSTADPAYWQHMVTFGVSIGLQGTLDPTHDLQSITNGSKNWPDPTDTENDERIDDLWHAAVNGHGNFVAATNPTEFVQGLISALATVAQRLGSASNVTANSTSFQTDTRVYQASYVSGKWTGELAAYEVSSAGISTVDSDGDGIPDAAWQASDGIPAYASRKIYTWSGSDGSTFPTTAQTAALDKSTRASVNGGPTTGAQNAAYIAGSQTLEVQNGGTLRDRDVLLGDIANSSPMYVDKTKTIYVGANDGMLHGINALTGAELFAYVPAGISFSDLGTLSDPQYSPNHRYFVDGPVVVSDTSITTGKNYLVGTLGRGGKGIYGLDVSDPTHFGTDDVLWDATGTVLGNDMGQILGEPLIVKLNSGDYGVITSNGINSVNGDAVLFVLDIDTGDVITKLDTGVGGDNGLSAPRGADTNGDGVVDYVYAGDLKGNIWKFDLSSTSSGSWDVANGGDPMFTATDPDGTAQPITAGLAIARDPDTRKIWIFAGTGSFMTSSDVTNTGIQSLYGMIDDGTAITTGRAGLLERQIAVTGTQDGRDVRGFEAHAAIAGDERGWFIDLDDPTAGERIVSNPRVRGTVLLAASMIPPQENTCDAGGTGYINALDAFSGTSLSSAYFDSNNDAKVDDDDKIQVTDGGGGGGSSYVPVGSIDLGVGMPTLPTLIDKLLVVGGSKGTLGSIVMNPQGGSARRTSWREILRD